MTSASAETTVARPLRQAVTDLQALGFLNGVFWEHFTAARALELEQQSAFGPNVTFIKPGQGDDHRGRNDGL